MGKIINIEQSVAAMQRQRDAGRRIVFTNGCFDLLHSGHVRYLQQARELGDALVVGLNSDASVRMIKGPKRPINNEKDRAEVLSALICVDFVILFDEPDPLLLIQALNPHVLVKGADWSRTEIVGGDYVTAQNGKVVRIPLVPQTSTTAIINRIIKRYGN